MLSFRALFNGCVVGLFMWAVIFGIWFWLTPDEEEMPAMSGPDTPQVEDICKTSVECMTCVEQWPDFDNGEFRFCNGLGYEYTWIEGSWRVKL